MSTINKLEKFRQNTTFKCLLQPQMEEVFRKDYIYKGRWHEVFGNSNPITLELGCGKGEYTTALAELYPDRNFIGIDIKGARLWKGAKYVETKGLQNVRFIRTNIDFIEWIFGEGEIEQIWITFADPQIKSPRKRLTSTMFLERYSKFLCPEGIIHLKTDSRLLHEYTKALAVQNNLSIIYSSTDIYKEQAKEGNNIAQKAIVKNNPPAELFTVQTFYEQYFLKLGIPITYLSFALGKRRQFTEPLWDSDFWRAEEEKIQRGKIR